MKKTVIESACAQIPEFAATYQHLLTNIRLNGRSESSLQNYKRGDNCL